MTVVKLAQLLIEGPRIVLVDDVDAKSDGQAKAQAEPGVRGRPDHQPIDNDEDSEPKIDKKIGVFLNRAILRIFSVPSLMQYLKDVVLFTDEGDVCKIQFVFHRLPDEAVPQLTKLLAAPREPKYTRFVDKGQAKTGVELEVQPDDFGGEEFDYAF